MMRQEMTSPPPFREKADIVVLADQNARTEAMDDKVPGVDPPMNRPLAVSAVFSDFLDAQKIWQPGDLAILIGQRVSPSRWRGNREEGPEGCRPGPAQPGVPEFGRDLLAQHQRYFPSRGRDGRLERFWFFREAVSSGQLLIAVGLEVAISVCRE